MNHSTNNRTLLAAAISVSLFLGGCAATSESPQGAADVRNRLDALQNNPDLANRTRLELRAAEEAVQLAERPLSAAQSDLGEHRVYMADRKVEIASARATTLHAEAQRERLSAERGEARLAARTSEVARARDDARSARGEADAARASEMSSAAASAVEAQRLAGEMQQQIDDLQAEVTDRGLVLTLGDVLFATGSSDLQHGTNANLDKLVSFLNDHPQRNVLVEGHTDNVGGKELNQALSLRRAETVRNYLTGKGIESERLTAEGIGMDRPIADNNTPTGRQQNRRVEIVIGHTYPAAGLDSR
ncbi:OmpA family protein [Aquisalimonas sp.]|uniref:OmpA family protein n=1 Tax=Aquisalimonas sp. TaxID=1872621 RepID=UPI0025B889BC|nr:OmpA family protein [Aquisalimonas sp.]